MRRRERAVPWTRRSRGRHTASPASPRIGKKLAGELRRRAEDEEGRRAAVLQGDAGVTTGVETGFKQVP